MCIRDRDAFGNVGLSANDIIHTLITDGPEVSLSIDDVTADNILNIAEASEDVAITGTVSGDFQADDVVTLRLNGASYTSTVTASGDYSIDVTGSELMDHISFTVRIESVDSDGNVISATAQHIYTVDALAPVLTGTVENDSVGDLMIVGTTSEPAGTLVSVSNAANFGVCSAIVEETGDWQCTFDATAEQGDFLFVASITDNAENTHSIDVDLAESLDRDNDGITDLIEGAVDTDNDGVPDRRDLDSDNDGLTDSIEAASLDIRTILSDQGPVLDTDFDGIGDFRDLDSDNDGLPDTVESQGVFVDEDWDGVRDDFVDADLNGLDDGLQVIPVVPADTDGDGLPDRRDLDLSLIHI